MKIADGVHVHFIPTQKYKTNRIVFRMTASLNKQTIAKRALASQMLATANQPYPTIHTALSNSFNSPLTYNIIGAFLKFFSCLG